MHKLDLLVSRFEELTIGALLVAASVLLFVNVCARYLFNLGIPWAEEVVRFGIIWMVFLGGSVAARRGMHIGVDILLKVVGPRMGRIITALINVVAIGFCAYLAFYAMELASLTRSFGQVSPAARIPIWLVQLAIPLGCALMAVRFAQNLIGTITGRASEVHLESIG